MIIQLSKIIQTFLICDILIWDGVEYSYLAAYKSSLLPLERSILSSKIVRNSSREWWGENSDIYYCLNSRDFFGEL